MLWETGAGEFVGGEEDAASWYSGDDNGGEALVESTREGEPKVAMVR